MWLLDLKDFFDRVARTGLEKGFLFRSRADAAARGYQNTDKLIPITKDMNPSAKTFSVFDSEIFNAGVALRGIGDEVPADIAAQMAEDAGINDVTRWRDYEN